MGDRLEVIALVSGGKDSWYSLLHCLRHGHRIVALANLYPGSDDDKAAAEVEAVDPAAAVTTTATTTTTTTTTTPSSNSELDSFMYQTAGHEVVSLYAAATGIPLYRRPILGRALRQERDYEPGLGVDEDGDETESMLPLLRAVMARHPEANALSSGAILSTYQRTRVESIALRLGLVPLAYLWKYPLLPSLGPGRRREGQLLKDMAAAGLEARIVQVSTGGLTEGHLWLPVTAADGIDRLVTAMRRYIGDEETDETAQGALLGEGGEFETIVLDGPPSLFRRRIVIPDEGRVIVSTGGGAARLVLRGARLEKKEDGLCGAKELAVREPDLLDGRFKRLLRMLQSTQEEAAAEEEDVEEAFDVQGGIAGVEQPLAVDLCPELLRWSVTASVGVAGRSIREETRELIDRLRQLLSSASREPSEVTSVMVILRDMAHFPDVNEEYGKLFMRVNPPSRVTISCGHLLPAGRNVVVHLTVAGSAAGSQRGGLHVQSRSYWAPANIGPYSQAIEVPLGSDGCSRTGPVAVYVAGQIPLIPGTMSLPPVVSKSWLLEQVVLGLQHVWRIGAEVGVQWWTSAVAYRSRPSSVDEMEPLAKVCGRAWQLMHDRAGGAAEESDDDDSNINNGADDGHELSMDGLDLWDLRYNGQYRALGGGGGPDGGGSWLPDWKMFGPGASSAPPVFVVEVESLPRGSAVEWQVHMGLGKMGRGQGRMRYEDDLGVNGWRAWQLAVAADGLLFAHTVLALRSGEGTRVQGGKGERGNLVRLRREMEAAYRGWMARLYPVGEAAARTREGSPYLCYVDASAMDGSVWEWGEEEEKEKETGFAVVPCRSIWTGRGERVGCVALYRVTMRTGCRVGDREQKSL